MPPRRTGWPGTTQRSSPHRGGPCRRPADATATEQTSSVYYAAGYQARGGHRRHARPQTDRRAPVDRGGPGHRDQWRRRGGRRRGRPGRRGLITLARRRRRAPSPNPSAARPRPRPQRALPRLRRHPGAHRGRPRGGPSAAGRPELLARLAARFALVAVVSGRPADFLAPGAGVAGRGHAHRPLRVGAGGSRRPAVGPVHSRRGGRARAEAPPASTSSPRV